MGKRRKFTDQFKARVALEALRGDKTIQEICKTSGSSKLGEYMETSGC